MVVEPGVSLDTRRARKIPPIHANRARQMHRMSLFYSTSACLDVAADRDLISGCADMTPRDDPRTSAPVPELDPPSLSQNSERA